MYTSCLFGLEAVNLDLTYFGPLGLVALIRPSHWHTSFLECNDQGSGCVSVCQQGTCSLIPG